MHFSKSILHLHCQNAFETNQNKTNSNHPRSCVSIINRLLYSISISHNRSLSLRFQAVRNNLRSIFPILQNSQVLERNAIRMRGQSIIRHTQLHFASPQTRLRTHSSRNASQRASVVGLRGSFATSLPLDGTTPPDSHMPSLPSANSTLFPAKASRSMQYLRIPAGTSPIHTDCVRALPPLRLSSHQSMGSCLPILPITLPRGSTGSTSGHLRRTCPQDKRCRRWARLRGALPRRCWPILWKGKAEFPSSEPTPNQDGGLAAEPTRGEDASCTARCRFERDARGSRWDVLESGEKEECVWFTRRYRFLVGW